MPVSDFNNIAPILHKIATLNPKKILDLGIGFGKFGCLIREIQEAVHGRCKPEQFENILDGVEGFEAYRNPLWELYDHVSIANFADEDMLPYMKHYDLVIAVDSMEHLEKDVAVKLIDHLIANNKHVIVSVPLGVCPQGAVFGNELETHRADWYSHDFRRWEHTCLNLGVCFVAYLPGKWQ